MVYVAVDVESWNGNYVCKEESKMAKITNQIKKKKIVKPIKPAKKGMVLYGEGNTKCSFRWCKDFWMIAWERRWTYEKIFTAIFEKKKFV